MSNPVVIIGVADGVGGWRHYGIDPSLFSKKLMDACEMLVKSDRFVPNRPVELLASGYQELLEDKKPLVGKLSIGSAYCLSLLWLTKVPHTENLYSRFPTFSSHHAEQQGCPVWIDQNCQIICQNMPNSVKKCQPGIKLPL